MPRALLHRHSCLPLRFQILLSNLTTNLWHELKVQGATRSIYNQSLVYRGDFSESQKILLRLNCDEVHASTVVRTEDIGLELSAGMIAGGACVGFALILAVLAVALWRKYFNESYYYLDESPATPVIAHFLFDEVSKLLISNPPLSSKFLSVFTKAEIFDAGFGEIVCSPLLHTVGRKTQIST